MCNKIIFIICEVLILNQNEKTACFTGHREIRKEDFELYSKVYDIAEKLILSGYIYFGAGGARGFDRLASEAVLELKKKYSHIHLILVLPFINQYEKEEGWSIEEIDRYNKIKKEASKIVYTQKYYSRGCYYKRNRHLVDHSSVCICYQYKYTGGTAYTIEYAKKKGIKILNCI